MDPLYPSREAMARVVDELDAILRIEEEWGGNLGLPAELAENVDLELARAIFGMAKSLAPREIATLSHHNASDVQGWPAVARPAVHGVRHLLASMIRSLGLEAMAEAEDFGSWASGAGEIPKFLDHVQSNLQVIRCLARRLPRSEGRAPTSRRPAPSKCLPGGPFNPRPNGMPLPRPLEPDELLVIAALHLAWPRGMSLEDLELLGLDGVAIIQRLLESGEGWETILRPWEDGGGYRFDQWSILRDDRLDTSALELPDDDLSGLPSDLKPIVGGVREFNKALGGAETDGTYCDRRLEYGDIAKLIKHKNDKGEVESLEVVMSDPDVHDALVLTIIENRREGHRRTMEERTGRKLPRRKKSARKKKHPV